MIELFDNIVITTGRVVWGPHLLLLLVGTGIYFTYRLRGIQFRMFVYAVKNVILGIQKKDRFRDKEGDISPLQSLMTGLAAVVGNGNIVGVATALALGGPGAIFWMWVAALFGMATKFCEAVLGVHYRQINPDGSILGGPMLYLKDSIKWGGIGKILAGFFALSLGLRALLSTSMVQSNSISIALNTQIGMEKWMSGLLLAFLVWIVIIGGIKSIGRFAEILAPLMSIVYISSGIAIMILFWREIPGIIYVIVSEAFTGTAATGGFAGSSIMMAVRFGVARGSYSNEAGSGSAAIAHSAAKTDQPVRQGLIAMLDVFLDTIVICSITAFAILLTGEWLTGATGAELATNSFQKSIPFGGWIIVFSSILFGYTSVITWPYFGEQCFAYLFGFWIKPYYRWAFCGFVFLGSMVKVNSIWLLADTLNGLMVLPNMIGILALSGLIVSITSKYFQNNKFSE
jgi:AGCS family alanine or glycine:cation symporter